MSFETTESAASGQSVDPATKCKTGQHAFALGGLPRTTTLMYSAIRQIYIYIDR